ncbi:F-box protein At5g46170-like [Quercus robur]|uniref:F-box protein At5g46170-like n=1 Tax=Quercus robur TaxID=38942 RepID=UPI002163AA0D|nr:F-box protein At5g46170-like [Quercus robur]
MLDLTFSKLQSHIDHFNHLPDFILLLIFNRISDVKALGWCCVISRLFHSLVPQVDNVVVRVACVFSDDDSSSSSLFAPAISSSSNKSRNPFSNLFRFVFGGITRFIFFRLLRSVALLKDFNEIRFLRIELPSGELGIEDGVLFFREDVEFFDFMGFLCVCFPRKFLGLWVC